MLSGMTFEGKVTPKKTLHSQPTQTKLVSNPKTFAQDPRFLDSVLTGLSGTTGDHLVKERESLKKKVRRKEKLEETMRENNIKEKDAFCRKL